MSDEAFLAGIEDVPEDRTGRLIYADWLEERGDPRAALIRTEEEIRKVPVAAERYWELKRCRNELRGRCDIEWLRRMRYGTDYEPVFREVTEDWRGRWRLLREFVERWFGLPLGDVGGRRREIHRVEKRLGHTLPPAVREWIAFHADIKPSWDEVFRDHYKVKHLENRAAVSLYLQWEGNHYWAVNSENLHVDDPPVENYDLVTPTEVTWCFRHRGLSAARLTDFVFYHIDFYLTQGVSTGCIRVRLGSHRDVLELVNAAFPVTSRFGEMSFFETTNLLAWLDSRCLLVKAPRSLSRQELPTCLRKHVTGGEGFREMVVQWPHD